MPKNTYTRRLEKNWSLIVTRSFLQEMSEVALTAGWNFHDCTISGGDSEIACPTLDDIAQVPAHDLETVRKASLTYKRAAAESGEYAFITLQNHHPAYGREGFSMHLSASDSGEAFKLWSSINSFLKTKKQWYSWLSTTYPYWPLICLPLVISMVTGAIQYRLRRPISAPGFVENPALALDFVALVMMFFRLRLFPANDFNLTDPPAPVTRAAQLRNRTWLVLKWAGGIIVAAWLKHRFA